ncbi:MAG: DUF2203 domain-containing protein [Bacteroidota bacterium]
MPQTEVKYFTPKEAKRTLPLVKQIVRDILDSAFQIRTIAESLGGRIEDNQQISILAGQINSFMKELEEIGCTYKDWDFQFGLVDFPAILEGKEVLLCWRSDEEDISFYHGLDEGFYGRKPIPHKYL